MKQPYGERRRFSAKSLRGALGEVCLPVPEHSLIEYGAAR